MREGGAEMKTLKDLRWEIQLSKYDIDGFVLKESEVRQEAIKRAKHIIEQHNLPHINIHPTSYQEGTTWQDYDERLCFIRHFFNITEEDLK